MGKSTLHTADTVNRRLSDRNIVLTGQYVNALTKTTFRCAYKHEWSATPNNVLRGRGCPHCSNRAKLDVTTINDRLKEREIEAISPVIKGRTLFRHLICDTKWESGISNVLNNNSGCPECAGNVKLSNSLLNERLQNRNIVADGKYVNARTPMKFNCEFGHSWLATPDNILRGKGCPECAAYGFDPSKQAWEYIFVRDGYLKYGITNDLPRRLKEHRRGGELTLVHEQYHKTGYPALEWENGIKRTYGGKFASKEQCPDGYTETLSLSHLSLLLR